MTPQPDSQSRPDRQPGPGTQSGYGKKALIVFGLMLALWLAILLLRLVVFDRQSQADVAAYDIASSWGGEQVIAGPFLQQSLVRDGTSNTVLPDMSLFTIAAQLKADVQLETQARKRTVHTVTVYTAQMQLDARFAPDAAHTSSVVPTGYQRAGERSIALYVHDVSGLEGMPLLTLAGKSLTPYTLPRTAGPGGTWLAWRIPAEASLEAIKITAGARGVKRVSILPSAASNDIRIAGDWPHPSFDGARLPDNTQISDAGFSGQWSVSALAAGLPTRFSSHSFPDLHSASVGVSLMPDVDPYKMLDRATKYGLMVVALTFLTLLLFEVRGGLALHPIPYMLMGSALVLFFMSLLSLAEYLPFWAAYVVSAGIIVTMIGSYAKAILATREQVRTLCGCLAGLYALLYLVLKLQDFAMLGGTALLLAALGGTMYLTRDIEWNRPLVKP